MSDLPPVGLPNAPDTRGKERGRLASWIRRPKTIFGALIVALTAWFILANTAETRIHFWVVWVSAKLWIALVVTFGAGLIVGFLLRRRGDGRRKRGGE